jgi:hypothetical protein
MPGEAECGSIPGLGASAGGRERSQRSSVFQQHADELQVELTRATQRKT